MAIQEYRYTNNSVVKLPRGGMQRSVEIQVESDSSLVGDKTKCASGALLFRIHVAHVPATRRIFPLNSTPLRVEYISCLISVFNKAQFYYLCGTKLWGPSRCS